MCGLTDDDFGYALETKDPLQELLASQQYRFVVNGHTHRRMVRHLGQLTVINAGTLFRESHPCFAIVDFAAGRVQFFEVAPAGFVSGSIHSIRRPT